MNLAKSADYFDPALLKDNRCHILGCGSVGSCLAEMLTRFGVKKFTLYDFDIVESKNIVNQMFFSEDIGKPKVYALERILKSVNPEVDIEIEPEGYTGQQLSGFVFLCIDNVDVLRQMIKDNMYNPFIKGMFDFRTELTGAQHYACSWDMNSEGMKSKQNFLNSMDFTHEEAKSNQPVSACGITLGVAPTVRNIVNIGVCNFVNWLKDNMNPNSLKKMILMDSFNFNIIVI